MEVAGTSSSKEREGSEEHGAPHSASFASDVIEMSQEPVASSSDVPELHSSTEPTVSAEPTNVECTSHKDMTCIFCNKRQKKVQGQQQGLHLLLSSEALNKLENKAVKLDDINFLSLLQQRRSENTIMYHNACKKAYENSVRSTVSAEREDTEWHKIRSINKKAFEEVCRFVSENIIEKGESFFLSFLHSLFIDNIPQFEGQERVSIKPYHLENRLLSAFKNKQIKMIEINNKKIVKPYRGVILRSDFGNMEKRDILHKAAMILRREVLNVENNKLPDEITVSDLKKGECDIPIIVQNFYADLLSGGNVRRQCSSQCSRLIKSFSEDVIYSVHNGRIKPSKHINLGMAIKSLTNSRKIVNILNRYGHVCSYSALESLETEATFTVCQRTGICPEDIKKKPNLCTGVAFNNFDRFVDTPTGKDTMHDTVGIIFQNIDDSNEQENEQIPVAVAPESAEQYSGEMQEESSQKFKRRRRTFDVITYELEEYSKRPRIAECIQRFPHELNANLLQILRSFDEINFMWMLSHLLRIDNTPMWVGYNCLIFYDKSVQQKISYLTTINFPPTVKAVIMETMKQAQTVAEECNQQYIEVTYDLGIAKEALKIQSHEKPRFDNLFIHVGTFHVMMAFFKAIGKFIDGCGVTNIMVDSMMLASGSVNTFLTGKHYNRCKRLHPIVSLGFQILLFESFIEDNVIEITDEMKKYLCDFTTEKHIDSNLLHEELMDLFTKYEEYKKKTREGNHGKTAQFYVMYIDFIDYFLLLNYSLRKTNFDLLKYVLPKITNLFFIFNQPNYSRYLVKYHENLMKIDESHPGLRENMEKGSFGIRRTEKPFSRIPIDLTLEQTINADAANKLTGVTYSTNSISARQRWSKSHSIRAALIDHVMEEAGIRNKQDVTADLQQSRIKHSSTQLRNFVKYVKENVNPFAKDIDKSELFNISSGQAAEQNIATFLLSAETRGNELREKFIEQCSNDPERFEKTISQNKIFNFTSTQNKKKIALAGKVVEVRMQRDLFGQLLCLSLEKELDIRKVLKYPLTPIPFSMCHVDGSICKTDKSALLKLLDRNVRSVAPQLTDVLIFDGFFVLHLLKDIPLRFGLISQKILQIFTSNNASTIIIAFDRYFRPSIKDHEHKLRGTRSTAYHINGPDQVRPSDFVNELKNIEFKEALVKFLIDDWCNDHLIPFIAQKKVYINFDRCYKYEVVDNHVTRVEDRQLSCPAHEEADTKIIFHICKIDFDAHVTIRTSDTDITIIMLGNMHRIKKDLKISVHLGSGNSQKHININQLYENLSPDLSAALLAFHAFTGCDFNSAFFRKGKKRPYTLLQKSNKYIDEFKKFSCATEAEINHFSPIFEEFLCRMYGFPRLKDINEVRIQIFMKTYKIVNSEGVLQMLKKNIDGSLLPPCKVEFQQHLLRTFYISNLWANAHSAVPTNLDPLEYGWLHVDNTYHFKWFEGEQVPKTVQDITVEPEPDVSQEEDENVGVDIELSDSDSDAEGDDDDSNL